MKYHDLEPTATEIAEIEERKAEARIDKINYARVNGKDSQKGNRRGRVASTGPTPKQRLILDAAALVVDERGFVKYADLRRKLKGAIPDVVGLIFYMKQLGRWPYKTYGCSRRK